MRLILIRHGETRENSAGIVQGHGPGTISDKGKRQAHSAARTLADVNPDAIYSSDLARALQTARIIAERLNFQDVKTDARLREQCFGAFEGGSTISILRQMKRDKTNRLDFNPKGGERGRDFLARVEDFTNEIRTRHREGTVIAITHSGVINAICNNYLPGTGHALQTTPNCGRTTIDIT